jgi:hypothetical protein
VRVCPVCEASLGYGFVCPQDFSKFFSQNFVLPITSLNWISFPVATRSDPDMPVYLYCIPLSFSKRHKLATQVVWKPDDKQLSEKYK